MDNIPESPQPQQPYAGQQYPIAPPPPPKKKRKKWPIVLGIIALLMILGIGGCLAIAGSAFKAVDKSVTESSARSAPRDVTVGTAFKVGSHETLAGWKAVNEGGSFNVTGKVKNTSTKTSTAFIHFKFLSKTGEVLGNVDCNSADLEPDQTQALNCISDGKYTKNYAKVTAEATF